MSATLADCLRYNKWANLRLIEACSALTEDQLHARATQTARSVRELISHLVAGELTFVLRTKGRQHEGESRDVDGRWLGCDVLHKIVARTGDELIAIAADLDDRDVVDLPHRGKRYRYPRGFILLHAFEHGCEHRTEIKVTLAQHGIATPDLDGWSYSAAAGYGQEVAEPGAGTASPERDSQS